MKEPRDSLSSSQHERITDVRAREFKIVREVLGGNTEEFRFLVETYKNRVFSLVLRAVGDRPVAEELTQEVFVKAYSNLAQFRFEASFGTWLTCIALNHTTNYFDSKRYKQSRCTVSYEPQTHESKSQAEESLTNEVLLESFRSALSELKPQYRDIIVLCSLEGKSYEEASAILDIPVGTVRSRLNRARERLRTLIEQRTGAV